MHDMGTSKYILFLLDDKDGEKKKNEEDKEERWDMRICRRTATLPSRNDYYFLGRREEEEEEEEEGRKSYALSLVQRGRWHGAEKEEWGTRGEPRDDI